MEGGSYNKLGGRPGTVPHDLAHLIVEDELALTRGVWGVLAAGGLFRHATVVSGRQAPHAAARGRAIVAAAHGAIMQAELLTRSVCDALRGGPAPDVPADVLDRCAARLRRGAADWAALPPGGELRSAWPHPPDPGLASIRP